jgi:transposase-like protein
MKEIITSEYNLNCNAEICCKHCGSKRINRNGRQKGKQRYYCRDCKKTFSEGVDNRIRYPLILRRLAITLYLSGTSISGIQKSLSICFNRKIYFKVVNDWLMNANNILEEEKQRRKEKEEYPPNDKPKNIPIVEMDELFTYIKKTKKINYRKTIP